MQPPSRVREEAQCKSAGRLEVVALFFSKEHRACYVRKKGREEREWWQWWWWDTPSQSFNFFTSFYLVYPLFSFFHSVQEPIRIWTDTEFEEGNEADVEYDGVSDTDMEYNGVNDIDIEYSGVNEIDATYDRYEWTSESINVFS